jgi:putative ATP-binding cassette transporter
MQEKKVLIDRHTWNRFVRTVKVFVTSEQAGTRAKWLVLLLILFMLGINSLNVVNSYVGRDFFTAIENRNRAEFIRQALLYIGVFAASTIVAVFYRYIEERLGLLWREWATRRATIVYGNSRLYYRLKKTGGVDNPDQRIAEDIRTYVETTISFVLMLLNGTFTAFAFSGVLWTISPLLFVVAVAYAAAGTFLTFIFGRPLVRLNYDQLDKEANFRASLTYLRANADSMAVSRREGHLIKLGLRSIGDLVGNYRRIIAINRNVNFFTTGYNWLIQIIPALIVAPLFIEGKVQFGLITQSAIAFTQLLGAFSLIVTQFRSISSYTAVLARLSLLIGASEPEKNGGQPAVVFSRDEDQIACTGLTLCSPRSGRELIRDLTLAIPRGRNLLVRGQDESARSALFRAFAGLWDAAEGRIARPSLAQLMLLSEAPFLPPGTLRELFMRPLPEQENQDERTLEETEVAEERILETLRTLKIEKLATGFGLDSRQHWENTLPLAEQQLLVVARLLLACPAFVFLDRPGATLSPEQIDWILGLLRERSITYVTFEDEGQGSSLKNYDALLELGSSGAWAYRIVKDGKISEDDREALSVKGRQ